MAIFKSYKKQFYHINLRPMILHNITALVYGISLRNLQFSLTSTQSRTNMGIKIVPDKIMILS